MGDFLHDHLKRKRFLVVLDDIWRSDDWKCLANAFLEENDGNRLLLTTRNKDVVVPAKALMPTMLVQEHKDKTITHTIHEVLTWFDQPCLRPRMRENNSTI